LEFGQNACLLHREKNASFEILWIHLIIINSSLKL